MHPPRFVCQLIVLLTLLCLFVPPAFSSQGAASSPPSALGKVSLSTEEQAFLIAHPVIRLGVGEDWTPYVIRRPSGELEGFEVDLLQRISTATGAKIQLVAGPWKETVEKAERRELDGLALTVTNQDRAASFLFSSVYLTNYPVFVVSDDNRQSFNSLDDFRGKTVAILAGNKFYRSLLSAYPEITVLEKTSETEALRMVMEGKATAAIIASTMYEDYFKKFARTIRIGYVATDKPLNLVYSTRKDWPELVTIINKGLAALPVDEFNKIYSRWFGMQPPIVGETSNKPDFSAAEQAWLAQKHVVRVHIGNYMPYYSFTAEKGVRGISVDYLNMVAERAGFKIDYVPGYTWSQALQDIRQHHNFDILPAAYITPERTEYLTFTNEYLKSPSVIFTRNDSLFVDSIADLAEKTVVLERDYATVQWLAEGFPAVKQLIRETTDEALHALAAGEADAYIGSLAVATYIARTKGLDNLMVAAPSPFGSDNQAMAVRNDWPELAKIIDKTLATFTPAEHEAIIARWVPPIHYEYGINRRDVLKWVGMISTILLAIIMVVVIWNKKLAREVAARTLAEDALRRELSFSEILLAQAPMGIRVFDGETGICNKINQAAADIAGGPVEVLLHQSFRELKSWQDAGLTSVAEMVLTDGAARQVEAQMTTSFGRSLWARYFFARFFVEGRPHLMTIGQDISEEKHLEKERRHIEEQMLHVQKLESLGVLAGGIAHDFNNILMVVIGNTDLALMRLAPESPVATHLRQIQIAAKKAAGLAGQMLAYSGRGKFVVEKLDLNRVVEEMMQMLEVSISKKVEIRSNFSQHLPAVEADITQIRQVIMNLVINASEAIGDSSGVITISTGTVDCHRDDLDESWLGHDLSEGLYACLEVADTGCGMAKETITRIYDPFFTTKFTGRGLGMAAVMGIVRGHKGIITVDSEVGSGTTFKVLLPALLTPATLHVDAPPDSSWHGSGQVLLVDDEEAVLAVGKVMLEELGFKVLTASDGLEALALFKEHRATIGQIVMDLTMPRMGGEEAFCLMCQLDPEVKVIMTSGYNEEEISHLFGAKGLAGFIQKPFRLSTLQDALQAVEVKNS